MADPLPRGEGGRTLLRRARRVAVGLGVLASAYACAGLGACSPQRFVGRRLPTLGVFRAVPLFGRSVLDSYCNALRLAVEITSHSIWTKRRASPLTRCSATPRTACRESTSTHSVQRSGNECPHG